MVAHRAHLISPVSVERCSSTTSLTIKMSVYATLTTAGCPTWIYPQATTSPSERGDLWRGGYSAETLVLEHLAEASSQCITRIGTRDSTFGTTTSVKAM